MLIATLAQQGLFPSNPPVPFEGHSNWLSYMLVAKKQCGGILKIEQPGRTSAQRDLVVCALQTLRPMHAHVQPLPWVRPTPQDLTVPPGLHPCNLFHTAAEPLPIPV